MQYMDGCLDVHAIFHTSDKNNQGYLSVRVNGYKINVVFRYMVKGSIKYHGGYYTRVFQHDNSEVWKIEEIFETILDRMESTDRTVLHEDTDILTVHNCKYRRLEIGTGIQLVQIFDYVADNIRKEIGVWTRSLI